MAMQFAKMTGVERAAVLLLCLGEETTTQVFEELSDAEVRAITRIMVSIEHVPADVATEVVNNFKKTQMEYAGIFVQGNDFVRNAISQSTDHERAEALIDQLTVGNETRPLETISMMEPRMVAGLLESEYPQTIALILSTQKSEHTGRILAYLPDEIRADVMLRIGKIDKVSPEVISLIEDALQREIGVVASQDQKQLGGVDKVVDILGRMDKGADKFILTHIENVDPEMAEEIRRKMFTFEDLVALDGRSLQMILREVNNDSLTLALKTASEEIKGKIFANMSKRAAEMIQEDLDAMGPVRLSEVETMQQTIVKIAMKLEEDGQLVIPGRGGQGDVLV